MIDDRGRVRVMDFGIARHDTDLAITGDDRAETPIGGTRAFMAPEQVLGTRVDARADQYSFCVALRGALADHRPPRSIGRVLDRGPRKDPRERFATMEMQLEALQRAAPRRGQAQWVRVGAVVMGALATAAAGSEVRDRLQCEREAAAVDRLAPTTVTYPLPDFRARWREGRREACMLGRRVGPAGSPRRRCAHRLLRGTAAARSFALAELLPLDPALAVTDLLHIDPAQCRDENYRRSHGRAPPPSARALAAPLHRDLARAELNEISGRLDEARVAAVRALETATRTGHPYYVGMAKQRLAVLASRSSDADSSERLYAQGRGGEAIDAFRSALEYARDLPDNDRLARRVRRRLDRLGAE